MKKNYYILLFFVALGFTSCKKEVFMPSTQNDTLSNEVFQTRSTRSPEMNGDASGDESNDNSSINGGNIDLNDGQEIVDPKDPNSKPNPNRPRGTKAF